MSQPNACQEIFFLAWKVEFAFLNLSRCPLLILPAWTFSSAIITHLILRQAIWNTVLSFQLQTIPPSILFSDLSLKVQKYCVWVLYTWCSEQKTKIYVFTELITYSDSPHEPKKWNISPNQSAVRCALNGNLAFILTHIIMELLSYLLFTFHFNFCWKLFWSLVP